LGFGTCLPIRLYNLVHITALNGPEGFHQLLGSGRRAFPESAPPTAGENLMDLHPLALAAVPLLVGALVRLTRRPQNTAALPRAVRDLITLWLVLRNTDPQERGPLLRAHRTWRLPTDAAPAVRRGGGQPVGHRDR
jgi:hypothetical protein